MNSKQEYFALMAKTPCWICRRNNPEVKDYLKKIGIDLDACDSDLDHCEDIAEANAFNLRLKVCVVCEYLITKWSYWGNEHIMANDVANQIDSAFKNVKITFGEDDT